MIPCVWYFIEVRIGGTGNWMPRWAFTNPETAVHTWQMYMKERGEEWPSRYRRVVTWRRCKYHFN